MSMAGCALEGIEMKKVKIGIIGLGAFCASYHIPNLLKRSDVEIAAVCDISRACLDGRDKRLADSETFTDYGDMLDPDRIDGALVSTPNRVHFAACKLALERGIPTLVDKPITVTVADAEALVELSKARNCILMTAFTRHFMPSTEYVRRQLASGAVAPLMLTAIQRRSPVKRGVEDGGMLHRRTIHITDVLPWITGRRVVQVEGGIQYENEADHIEEALVDMRLELEGGLSARLLCIKTCDEYQDEVTVYADKRSYRLERDRLYAITRRDGWQRIANLPEYGNSSDHFIEAIKGSAPAPDAPFADPHSEDGLRALRVVFAMHEAAQTGRAVAVPR